MSLELQQRIVLGIEIEAYSISTANHSIGRRLTRPRPGLSEAGERFTRDASIGSEYNSRPFATIREAWFLLRAGLRKYLRGVYRSRRARRSHLVPLLVGGWTNRFAGAHVHLSVAERKLDRKTARSLAWHLHDYLPFFIALGANSPVWGRVITPIESNRLIRGNDTYFQATRRGELTSVPTRELVLSPGRVTKPPTLEIRVLDANLPDFLVATLCLIKAVALHWLRRKGAANRVRHPDYLRAREDAGAQGMRAHLPWRDQWLSVPRYLDRFLWEHRAELESMDVPDDVFEVLRLFKRGVNGARLLRQAVSVQEREHPRSWERHLARRYSRGLESLLSGNTLHDFASCLDLELPPTDEVWLGRRNASVDER